MRCDECKEADKWMSAHPAYDGDNCVLLCKECFQEMAHERGCLCSFIYEDEELEGEEGCEEPESEEWKTNPPSSDEEGAS